MLCIFICIFLHNVEKYELCSLTSQKRERIVFDKMFRLKYFEILRFFTFISMQQKYIYKSTFLVKKFQVQKKTIVVVFQIFIYMTVYYVNYLVECKKDISLFNSFVITFQIFLSITPFLAWHGKLLKFCQNKTSIIEKAG